MNISGKTSDLCNKYARQRTSAFELLMINIKTDGEIELPITSPYSMAPLISRGSIVTVRYTQIQDVHFGDIVVFNSETSLIAHRCIHTADDFLITKGDNLSERDQLLVTSRILIGKIVAVKCEGSSWDLTSYEWQLKNRKIAIISLWQNKFSELCLQVESKKIRLLRTLGWFFRRSFFYFYKFLLFIIIKYAPCRKA